MKLSAAILLLALPVNAGDKIPPCKDVKPGEACQELASDSTEQNIRVVFYPEGKLPPTQKFTVYARNAVYGSARERFQFPAALEINPKSELIELCFDDTILESAYFPVPDDWFDLVKNGKCKVMNAPLNARSTNKIYDGMRIIKFFRKDLPARDGDLKVNQIILFCKD